MTLPATIIEGMARAIDPEAFATPLGNEVGARAIRQALAYDAATAAFNQIKPLLGEVEEALRPFGRMGSLVDDFDAFKGEATNTHWSASFRLASATHNKLKGLLRET